jgi:integrase
MASIRKVSRKARNGRARWAYEVLYRDPVDRKTKSKTFTRRADADAFRSDVETDKRRGSWTDPKRGKLTVAEWSARWLKTKVDLRPTSFNRLRGLVDTHVVPEFGKVALADVSNEHVRRWVAKMLSNGSSASTTRKAFNALSQMMRAAVSDRRIVFSACVDVPLPAEHHNEQRFLSTDEVNVLADAIDERYRALVLVAAYGGLRWGELAGLRRSRVDVLNGTVTVDQDAVDVHGKEVTFGPPKTKNGFRTVPLPRRVVKELDNHMAKFTTAGANALVFTSPNGNPLRRSHFRQRVWIPAVNAIGLDGLREHDLRHTFVAIWVDLGVNPREVSKRAGHSSVAFTLDRYGHLFERDDDDVSDRLDALLDVAPPSGKATVHQIASDG